MKTTEQRLTDALNYSRDQQVFIEGQAIQISQLADQRDELLAACVELVRKVDAGEARSVRSYEQMKAAIARAEQPR